MSFTQVPASIDAIDPEFLSFETFAIGEIGFFLPALKAVNSSCRAADKLHHEEDTKLARPPEFRSGRLTVQCTWCRNVESVPWQYKRIAAAVRCCVPESFEQQKATGGLQFCAAVFPCSDTRRVVILFAQ